jgi:hypothetical protein
MAANIEDFRGRTPAGQFGGPPDGVDLFQRVSKLESLGEEIKSTLSRIEPVLTRVDERLRRAELDIAEIKGRTSQLPTWWQLRTALVTLAISVTALVFAILRWGIR